MGPQFKPLPQHCDGPLIARPTGLGVSPVRPASLPLILKAETMTKTTHPIPSRPDTSPHTLAHIADAESHTFDLPAPTAKGLTFTINTSGQRIGTAWELDPESMPDPETARTLEASEAKAYFNADGTLSPSLLQAALTVTYDDLAKAEAVYHASYDAADHEAGLAPTNANYKVLSKGKKPNGFVTVGRCDDLITPHEVAMILEAYIGSGFTMGLMGQLQSKTQGSDLPEWLTTASDYYAKRKAAFLKHRTAEFEENINTLQCKAWALRGALIACPVTELRDLYAKAVAFRDDCLGDMDLSDTRALLAIVRDLKTMTGGA